jgi:hypothetical protein
MSYVNACVSEEQGEGDRLTCHKANGAWLFWGFDNQFHLA